jgi:hypothetical protein
MKNIFCAATAVLFLLPWARPLALFAQEFKAVRSPLEGVWENEDNEEADIVFTGNLFLEKRQDSTYAVYPGMEYRNGEAYSLANPELGEPKYIFSYELSGNTLTLTDEYDEYSEGMSYKRTGSELLQNKSAIEGIWTTSYSDADITGVMSFIFIGQLLIMSLETDSFTEYAEGFEFFYSGEDNTLTAMDGTISCTVSGDTMTVSGGGESMVFTRKK